MLESLHVKNLALIEEAEVDFEKGLNILTGETGAGKSIILGSVNMALGGKAQKEMIRTGEDYALIELTFTIESEEQETLLKKMDIPYDTDHILLIQRKISMSRSNCKINGETVSQKQVQEIADAFIDVHGQNDSLFLRNQMKHLEILDHYCGNELFELKDKLKKEYDEYHDLLQKWNSDQMDEDQRKREISLLEYEVNEIEESNLSEGEDEVLEEKYRRMNHSQKLATTMNRVRLMLSNENAEGASDLVERALREMRNINGIDKEADDLTEQMTEIDNLLGDMLSGIQSFIDELDFEEADFHSVEERLNLINHLKDKYGSDISDIITYMSQNKLKLEKLNDYEQYRLGLKSKLDAETKTVVRLCEDISKVRKNHVKNLVESLTTALNGLNFNSVHIDMNITQKENFTSNGFDDAEFLISLNPGEPLKRLTDIASGGELSRIMLGIKTILAGQESGKTFIFDEIDAGISGKTAWQVAEKLGILSKEHQIICITHLAQIASMADQHYEIEKSVNKGITTTNIYKLNAEKSIEELSRLLGGDIITDNVRNNAIEMKKNADISKYGKL